MHESARPRPGVAGAADGAVSDASESESAESGRDG